MPSGILNQAIKAGDLFPESCCELELVSIITMLTEVNCVHKRPPGNRQIDAVLLFLPPRTIF